MADGAESKEQESENDKNRYRQNNQQTAASPFQVLELPAPCHSITLGQPDLLAEFPLRLGHEAALIAASNVRAHRNLPLVLSAGNDGCAIDNADLGKLRQRHAAALTGWNQDVSDSRGIAPRGGRIAYGDVESPFAFEQCRGGTSADGHFDHFLNVADIDSVPCHLLPVDAQLELCLVSFLRDRVIRGAADRLNHVQRLIGELSQLG